MVLGFNSSTRYFFVLGVRARPWWGLPQSVAVGVILIFPELNVIVIYNFVIKLCYCNRNLLLFLSIKRYLRGHQNPARSLYFKLTVRRAGLRGILLTICTGNPLGHIFLLAVFRAMP